MKNYSDVCSFWTEVIDIVKIELSEDNYNKWVKSIRLLSYDDNFVIEVPNSFFVKYLTKNCENIIKSAIRKLSGQENIDIEYKIVKNEYKEPSKDKSQIAIYKDVKDKIENKLLNKKFTFDKFIVGRENNIVYSEAINISMNNNDTNLLFIHGKTGVGKTHLLHAIAHKLLSENTGVVIEYLPCEEFVNLYIDSLNNKSVSKFRKYIRNIDMLIIDDIHFLSGKSGIQKEFISTLDALNNNGKKVIIASDSIPTEINSIEQKLVSRFEFGLIIEIEVPDFELRYEILKNKQCYQKTKLDDEILRFVAENVTYDIRKLEGAIKKLIVHSNMVKELNIENVKEILLSFIDKSQNKITIDSIKELITNHFNISEDELIGNRKTKEIVFSRMIAMYLSKKLTNNSLSKIGSGFGNRTHVTVSNAIKKIENSLKNDKELINTIEKLKMQLKNKSK